MRWQEQQPQKLHNRRNEINEDGEKEWPKAIPRKIHDLQQGRGSTEGSHRVVQYLAFRHLLSSDKCSSAASVERDERHYRNERKPTAPAPYRSDRRVDSQQDTNKRPNQWQSRIG